MDNNENNYIINSGAEQYAVTITKDEYMGIYKYLSKKRNKAILICLVIFVVMSLVFLPFAKFASFVFLILGLIYVALLLISSGSAKKKWVENSIIAENRTYLYDVFDDKLSLSVVENHELIKKISVSYENIKVFNENDEFYILTDDIQTYFIRKSQITTDSILIKKLSFVADKHINSKKIDNLFAAFLILTYGLFVFVLICKEDLATYFGNTCYWLYFTVTPFSVAMIIVSLVRKNQKLKWLHSLIAGIVVSVICFLGGIQQFGYNKYYNSGYNVIAETENHLGIDLPKPDYVSFYKDTVSEDNRIDIINDVMIEYYYYDFIDKSQNDKIWLNEVPDEFFNVIPFSDLYHDSDNVILYNVETKEINTVPESGTHQLVFISYIYDRVDIVEYMITL